MADFVRILVCGNAVCLLVLFLSAILLGPYVILGIFWFICGVWLFCSAFLHRFCLHSCGVHYCDSTLLSLSGLLSTPVISTSLGIYLVWVVVVFYNIAVFVCECYALEFIACHCKLIYSGYYFGWQGQYCPIVYEYSFPVCRLSKKLLHCTLPVGPNAITLEVLGN